MSKGTLPLFSRMIESCFRHPRRSCQPRLNTYEHVLQKLRLRQVQLVSWKKICEQLAVH